MLPELPASPETVLCHRVPSGSKVQVPEVGYHPCVSDPFMEAAGGHEDAGGVGVLTCKNAHLLKRSFWGVPIVAQQKGIELVSRRTQV